MRRAMVVGVSGNIGKLLVQKLVNNKMYRFIIVFTRINERKFKHIHIKKVIVDFKQINQYQSSFLEADEVFCLLGSNYSSDKLLEDAAQLDYEIPLAVAQMAKAGGVNRFVLVNPHCEHNHATPYLKRRWQLEKEIAALGFEDFKVFRVNQIAIAKRWMSVRKKLKLVYINLMRLTGRKIEGYLQVPANILLEDMANWVFQQPELLNSNHPLQKK